MTEGRPFDLSRESGQIAQVGFEHLPKPGTPGLEVQKHFVLPSPTPGAGFGYQGYKDVWLPQGGLPGVPTSPAVVDFKTTSNLRYALKEDELAEDVQAQLYATAAMYETGARAVDLVWIYFQTRGERKSKRVHLKVDGQHVAKQFLAIDETAREMFAVRGACKVAVESGGLGVEEYCLSLPPNVDMCEQYGGCAFRHKCNLSPDQIIEAKAAKRKSGTMSGAGTTANLFANLKKKQESTLTLTAPGTAGTTAGAAVVEAASVAPKPVHTHVAIASVKEAAQAPAPYVGINPPESTLPQAPIEAAKGTMKAVETAAEDKPKRGRPKTKAEGESASSVGESVTVVWGIERYSPVQYQWFDVGPFTVTGTVQEGETRGQTARRLYDELSAFAAQARAEKAAAFKAALGA